jgi:hypothetical protein
MQARMRQIVVSAVAVALGVVLGGTAFAQRDPNLGMWKLNLAKSKYDSGLAPKSETIVNEAWDTDGFKYTITTVEADGKRVTSGSSAHYDGKDYKVLFVTGTPDVDTVAFKRVDPNTITYTLKKGGKVIQTGTAVVSNNGKVFTITATMTNAKGQKENAVAVYDKQ